MGCASSKADAVKEDVGEKEDVSVSLTHHAAGQSGQLGGQGSEENMHSEQQQRCSVRDGSPSSPFGIPAFLLHDDEQRVWSAGGWGRESQARHSTKEAMTAPCRGAHHSQDSAAEHSVLRVSMLTGHSSLKHALSCSGKWPCGPDSPAADVTFQYSPPHLYSQYSVEELRHPVRSAAPSSWRLSEEVSYESYLARSAPPRSCGRMSREVQSGSAERSTHDLEVSSECSLAPHSRAQMSGKVKMGSAQRSTHEFQSPDEFFSDPAMLEEPDPWGYSPLALAARGHRHAPSVAENRRNYSTEQLFHQRYKSMNSAATWVDTQREKEASILKQKRYRSTNNTSSWTEFKARVVANPLGRNLGAKTCGSPVASWADTRRPIASSSDIITSGALVMSPTSFKRISLATTLDQQAGGQASPTLDVRVYRLMCRSAAPSSGDSRGRVEPSPVRHHGAIHPLCATPGMTASSKVLHTVHTRGAIHRCNTRTALEPPPHKISSKGLGLRCQRTSCSLQEAQRRERITSMGEKPSSASKASHSQPWKDVVDRMLIVQECVAQYKQQHSAGPTQGPQQQCKQRVPHPVRQQQLICI